MFPKQFTEDRINKSLSYKCQPIIPPIDLDRILALVSKIDIEEPVIHKAMRYDPE